MYNSPFGSIFDGVIRPFGQTDPADKIEAEPKAPVEISRQSDVEKQPSPVEEMRKRAEEIQKSKVISPSKKEIEKKKPFSVLPPQFEAATTMESDDPRVKAEQSKIMVTKNKQKLAAMKRQISELKQKIKAAKVYRDVLGDYIQLDDQAKLALDGWVDIHEKAIQKLNSARKLKKKSKDTSEASKAIEAEIKHWEGLKKLKAQGVDVKGKVKLKRFRPKGKKTEASPDPKGPIPKIKSRVPTEELVRLTSKKAKQEQLQGLEATDQAAKGLAKEKPKKSYKEIFIDQLPGRDATMQQRNAKGAMTRLEKRTEKTIIRAKTLEWEISLAEDQYEQLNDQYRRIQENISDMIATMDQSPQTKKTAIALGVLVEAKPERFMGSPTLLKASMDAFKRLSQLGDTSTTPSSPEVEAEKMLQEAAEESAANLNELEMRQNALDQLKAEVEDKPAPPPIEVSVTLATPVQEKSKPKKAASFINRALPWIAGAFLLKKLMED